MMGTLAALLAGKKIPTPEDRYWADVKGDIENVDNVLKITCIKVTYHLKTPNDKVEEAREAFSSYIKRCPAAQSVIGCIRIEDDLVIEAM
ncbi:MAG: OsmC family protein [Proteobacteria bacterium]|nr:OsmC family protein [Pseudomonadota bacterium]